MNNLEREKFSLIGVLSIKYGKVVSVESIYHTGDKA
jgi:hypothetical protein